jgi:hypothetical protein
MVETKFFIMLKFGSSILPEASKTKTTSALLEQPNGFGSTEVVVVCIVVVVGGAVVGVVVVGVVVVDVVVDDGTGAVVVVEVVVGVVVVGVVVVVGGAVVDGHSFARTLLT